MSTFQKLTITALLSCFSSLVLADSGLYIGAKTGVIEPDASSYDADDDNPVALQLGYDFGLFALQAEAYSAESEVKALGDDAELDVIAAYGVFRTSGFFYFMAKGGLVDGEIALSGFDSDDTAVSYGIGAGLNFGDFIFVEAEYTLFDVDNVDFDFFGVSANIKF